MHPRRPGRLTAPRRWEPLTQEEVAALAPYFVHRGSGRPIFDIRARLDAIFWVACRKGAIWRDLPPELGPWDSAHRQFRRWAHKGCWTRLLTDVADRKADPVLKRLEHWICRAFRRALRILGLKAIILIRRLGLYSALKGPVWYYPDPDLSEALWPTVRDALAQVLTRPMNHPKSRQALRAGIAYHRLVGGRAYIPGYLEPP